MSETPAAAPDAYRDLVDHYRRISNVSAGASVLAWDQQVMMPSGGTPARSRQLSTLSGLSHELLVDDDVAAWLSALDGADLAPDQRAVVREIEREHRRAARVPQDLVERISAASSDALPVWEAAKREDDFDAFAPALEELVELKREYAAHVDPDADPYEALFADYEPYLGLDAAERVLGRLRDELVPLLDEIRASEADLASPFEGGDYPTDEQEALSREILDVLGYDWNRGRLDTSSHPFTSGNPFDCRITTRFDEADPLGALMATIHEFGHATYNLGLPQEHYGTPLGSSRDMTVHESQSRFWENHVGRTRAFWERILPIVTRHLGGLDDAVVDDVYEAANRIYPDNTIRVEADELTYHLHIVLRFEMERDLIDGTLDVAEVPAVWNDKMESYLGIRPETDALGCLQDIHWSHGSFGYFPTYSMGSVLAAQLHHAAAQDVSGFDDHVREGRFDDIHEWLEAHVHRHGSRYTTDELVREATGEDYTADYFLDYARGKFGDLYGL